MCGGGFAAAISALCPRFCGGFVRLPSASARTLPGNCFLRKRHGYCVFRGCDYSFSGKPSAAVSSLSLQLLFPQVRAPPASAGGACCAAAASPPPQIPPCARGFAAKPQTEGAGRATPQKPKAFAAILRPLKRAGGEAAQRALNFVACFLLKAIGKRLYCHKICLIRSAVNLQGIQVILGFLRLFLNAFSYHPK